ncbi:MAG TPA: haloacid dehalogenase type II [Candidatus Acidoferrales bacterium]|nr:haloacid dehalogenase type II [Candidatus Acidoferrales bacterium]
MSSSVASGAAPLPAPANSLGIKALVFDVFGTVVDWRGSIIREGAEWGKAKNLQVDWAAFADDWRAGYAPSMDKVRRGVMPWTKLDDLHRGILEDLLKKYSITGLTEEEKDHWNRVWHRLTPWPDAVAGLTTLKKNFIIATLSNGNVSLLVDMAKFGGLPWDTVFGSDLFRHFKPDHQVYLGAVDLLGCKPAEVMMVAAHRGDLNAAHACGLKTALVLRPLETRVISTSANPAPPSGKAGAQPPVSFDMIVNDFNELAFRLA